MYLVVVIFVMVMLRYTQALWPPAKATALARLAAFRFALLNKAAAFLCMHEH